MLDIILVNYNSTDHLIKCIRSIQEVGGGVAVNIFVVDNASSDDPERISLEFRDIFFMRNPKNLGFAKAANQGLRASTSEFVMLLNPDTSVKTGFFAACLDYMRCHPDVGILGPQILNIDGSLQNSARSFPTLITAFFGRSSILSRWFSQNPFTSKSLLSLRSDGRTPMEVDWVSGACMMIRKKAVEHVGLLDERFFMYWEDADWCVQMWTKGWKVVYFPQATVHHYIGGSSEKRVLASVFEFHKSVYRFFEKNIKYSYLPIQPLVFSGLAARCLFVLASYFIHRSYAQRRASPAPDHRPTLPALNDKIRILRVISRLNIGGPAIHVHILTTGLNSNKFRSSLVTGNISPREGDMSYLFASSARKPISVPGLQREIRILSDIQAFYKILKIIHAERPDIIDTHTAKSGTIARLAGWVYNQLFRRHARVVHTFHGHVFDGYFSRARSRFFVWIERQMSRITDAIIAISDTQKAEFIEKYRIAPAGKIKHIALGFDLQPFLDCHRFKGQLRRSLEIAEDTILVGIVGRLVPIKNHRMFLDMIKVFLSQPPERRVFFWVIGDGELKLDLMRYAQALRVDHRVRFVGWVKNVARVYADLDVLALTSLNEGTPVSIIEAMAGSVPVVATDAGGVKDLLGHCPAMLSSETFQLCERGILCHKNDPSGFARALRYLIEMESASKKKLIDGARVYVEKEYSKERLFRETENLYVSLINSQDLSKTGQGRVIPPAKPEPVGIRLRQDIKIH